MARYIMRGIMRLTLSALHFRLHSSSALVFKQTFDWKEVYNYVKLKDRMSNSVDPDEMAHYEPSHLDLRCLQKPIIIACGSERVTQKKTDFV